MITDIVHWTSNNMKSGDNNLEVELNEKDDTRRIVSASREDTVNIHDEDSQEGSKSCRYMMKQHKGAVNSLAL